MILRQFTMEPMHIVILLLALLRSTVHSDELSSDQKFAHVAKRMRQMFGPYGSWSGKNGRLSDRFRFFHAGLGKRNSLGSADNIHIDDTNIVPITKSGVIPDMFKSNPLVEAMFSHTNDYIKQSDLFKQIRAYATYSQEHKRSPEIYSESLYPIQSGKQELEVMLDKTLNIPADGRIENTGSHYVNGIDLESEAPNNIAIQTANEQAESDPSFDLLYSSPDIDISNAEKRSESVVSENKDNFLPQKRWWAATALNNFRSPKSSHILSRVRGRQPVDPVLYFIGLGK